MAWGGGGCCGRTDISRREAEVAHQGRATGDYWAADTTDYTDRVWRFIMTYAEYCTVLICPLQWEIESARECGSCAWLINFPTAISQNKNECQWCKEILFQRSRNCDKLHFP